MLLLLFVDIQKDVLPGDMTTIIWGFLQSMGMAHMVSTGFLVVANILECYETLCTNWEVCLSLLNEMNILTHHVKKIKKWPWLKEGMEASIKEASMLIVEAYITRCSQIDTSNFLEHSRYHFMFLG